jgi:hypothetical protein
MIDALPYLIIPLSGSGLLIIIGWIFGVLGWRIAKALCLMSAMIFVCSAVIVWSLDALRVDYFSMQSWSNWEVFWRLVGPILGFTQGVLLIFASIVLTWKQIFDPPNEDVKKLG